MAVKISQLLKQFADKAGIATDTPEFKAILDTPGEMPDATAALFTSKIGAIDGLMSLDVAKNHPDLKKHFSSAVLDGMDKKMKALADEYALTDDERALLDAEKNTYEKPATMAKILKARMEGASKGDKADLIKQIDKLNAQVLTERQSKLDELAAVNQAKENEITNYAFESYLGSKPYANAEIPAEVNIITAKTLIQKQLAEKGALLVRRNGQLVLVDAKNPELDFVADNKKISFNDLADATLAGARLLKVNDGNGPNKTPVRHANADPNNGKKPDPSGAAAADANRTAAAALKAQ